jgi:hypothetical protein
MESSNRVSTLFASFRTHSPFLLHGDQWLAVGLRDQYLPAESDRPLVLLRIGNITTLYQRVRSWFGHGPDSI